MRNRLIYLIVLAALAWLAPLMAVQSRTISADPAHATVIDVVTASIPADEPSLFEEEEPEEERWSELERRAVSLCAGATPTLSASGFAPAAPVALPTESLLASCGTPRGPPAC